MNRAIEARIAWQWLLRHAAVIATVLIIAGALGNMALFKTTVAVPGKLTAADIVKFLAYSGALAMLFLAAQRAALQLRNATTRVRLLGEVLVPLATLIVAASAHGVLLLVLKPFLGGDLRGVFNWLFVAACLASAAWLVLSVLGSSGPLQTHASDTGEAFSAALDDAEPGTGSRRCDCGAAVTATAKYCAQCGMSV